jgi:hypothetical protein
MLRHHRTRIIASLLALVTLLTVLALPLAPGVAQGGGQLQARPTTTPTQAFDPPVAANPTVAPTTPPDELAPNPTAVPTSELPLTSEERATLTIRKGVCDDAGFDATTAVGTDAFDDACASPDGEFEFTVTATGFAETATTVLGEVTFVVPVGLVSVSETIPPGWGDPAVFCWSNQLPTPSDTPFIGNAPTWDVQPGEQIDCHWYNIAIVDQSHTILVSTRECPAGTDLASDYWTLATTCLDPLPGTGVTLTPGGPLDTDANGLAAWSGVELGESGEIQIVQTIPEGFGEPAAWCTSYPVIAADAQDFDFFPVVPADGEITATPESHEPFIFACTFFNQVGDAPGGSLAIPPTPKDGGGSGVTLSGRR